MYNFLSQVQISPDGKKVAYVATTPDLAKNGYTANLYRIDAESGENACLTNSGRVKGFCWQGAETLLYTVPVEADDAFPDGQTVLYRQNAGSAAEEVCRGEGSLSLEGVLTDGSIVFSRVDNLTTEAALEGLAGHERLAARLAEKERNEVCTVFDEYPFWFNGKGAINNQMTNRLMAKMEKAGIPTHFVEELSERDTLVKKVSIVPLEVIIRNISAGHFASRYGVEEGIVFSEPTIEFSYKNDDLHDPLMNAYHAVALKLATWEEIELIKKYAFAVNDTLKAFWSECGVTLVDFKLEFGKTVDGQIVLADEISPDTCRLWDSKTNEKLDKDRFRRDLGGVEDAYAEVMKRLMAHDAQ